VWIEHKLKAPERLGRLRRWRKKIFISLKRSEANRLLTGRPRKAKR
jgi:hypothetical protein